MGWYQVLTIIIPWLAGIFFIHSDVKQLRKEIHQKGIRIDQLSERIEKQYQMFVDLIKAKNSP